MATSYRAIIFFQYPSMRNNDSTTTKSVYHSSEQTDDRLHSFWHNRGTEGNTVASRLSLLIPFALPCYWREQCPPRIGSLCVLRARRDETSDGTESQRHIYDNRSDSLRPGYPFVPSESRTILWQVDFLRQISLVSSG